jgi:serralysin
MSDNPRKQWVCSTIDVVGGSRVAGRPTDLVKMGVAAKDNLWKKGTVLKVGFLEGEGTLHSRVMQAASQWFLKDVKLSLEHTGPEEKAHVRIAFDAHGGSWSYIGTDSLSIHPSQPTMNLGWVTLDAPKEDFYSVVIHEFGHALGLLHEHNHPEARIEWNKAAVYAELSGPPNFWDKATIDSNVFAKFDASTVITTDFDNVSVMIYTVPERWTLNGKSFMPSWKLSEGDVATIKRLYG